jgi:hypothetical protein
MSESASASIAFTQLDPTTYKYSITLSDSGTTPIGTFWFSWVPGEGFLPDIPTFVAPQGWSAQVTDGTPPANGYSILWLANDQPSGLQPGQSLGGFSFTSHTAPATVFGTSPIHPPSPVTTSTVYSGGIFSDAGFTFAATAATNRIDDSITKLYVGYYNRAPDPAGEDYWAGQLQGGLPLGQIAQSYSVQPESTSQYAFLANPTANDVAAVRAFVDAIYSNLFNRAPDAAGEAFWVGQLQTGASTVGGAILNIINGGQGNDALTINNKLTVSAYYDAQVFSHNVQFSVASARAALGAVTSAPASVAAAEAIVDAYVKTAPAASASASQADVSPVGISMAPDPAHIA